MKNLISKLRESINKNSMDWGIALTLIGFLCVSLHITFYIIRGNTVIAEESDRRYIEVLSTTENNNIIRPAPAITPAPAPEPEIFGRESYAPAISSFITSVTAESFTGRVINTDTTFILTTDNDIETEELKSKLSLEAGSVLGFDVRFELSKSGERRFMLSASEILPEDSIIRLNLHDDNGEVERRWAFQTASIFKIASTLPADGGEHVPTTTGVEINFSIPVNAWDMPEYFSITEYGTDEEITGRFQRFRNTVVFIPANNLEPDTLYTVTVKEGLPSYDGIILEEGRTFSFRTAITNRSSLFFNAGGEITETFVPGDPVVLQIYCSQELINLTYDLKLYEFPNSEMYRTFLDEYIIKAAPHQQTRYWDDWYWGGSSRHRGHIFPTSELTEIYSSQEQLLRADGNNGGWWSPSYFVLPENLSEGWYLAEARTERGGVEYRVQKLIQINPISIYASSLPNEALFFINDTNTGLAAGNADVTINTGTTISSATADGRGIAHININAERRSYSILTVKYGSHTFIDLFNCRPHRERTPEENYFMLLYTDREVYRTTDEIYVWGVVIPREPGIPLPASVHLQAGTETENSPIPVTLNPDGTFTSHIKLQNNVETWWYVISLMTGDTIMCQKRINIRDFVKPTYVFDIDVPFYAWMPHINRVPLSLTASFFEGTPASDINFRVWGNNLVTDENGFAGTDILVEDSDTNSWTNRNTWRPQRISAAFELTGIENEYQRKTGSFWGIFRDVMLESEYNHSVNTLTVTTSMVDPTNFTPREERDTSVYYGYNYGGSWFHHHHFYSWGDNSWFNFAEILKGEAVDVTVTGTLTRHWTEKIPLGTHYDFIHKRTVTRYRHERRERVVGIYTINTVNGVGEFPNLPTNIEGSWYRMELEWQDTRGQRVRETVGLHNRERFVSWNADSTINRYTLIPDSRDFTENQVLNLQLENNTEPVTGIPDNARIFITVSGSEFMTTSVYNTPKFNYRMKEEYIPNVYISGAYFDGRHVFPISVTQYRFNNENREILINISADKERYGPSDRAAVTVTARDLQGRVVPNARVSFSAVDEAAFAVQNQRINTLRMLYAFIHTPWVETYHSYIQHSLFGHSPGESGGGDDGDTQVRRNFKDNAAFLTGTTDANGEALFYIDLPDNLTSWRLTVQVVGENADGKLCAGNTRQPLIVTIPLFLTVNSLPEYIYGDDIVVSARVNGQNINGNPLITATLTGENLDEPLTASAYSDEALQFGKLPLGMYTLLVTASDGINSDAIELPLEVVESLLETPVTRTFNLSEEEIDITPLRYPVSLTFYDSRNQTLQSQTLGYLFRSWGHRSDFRVAQAFARLELGHIDEDYYRETLIDISASNSLIRLLPYSEGDLTLTALICAAAPDVVNKGALTRQFYEIISATTGTTTLRNAFTSEEITYAYLGLAALNEPVLAEIQSLLADPEGLRDEDMLRLCAALALLGDEHTALEHYINLTENKFSERSDGTIRISTNRYTALSLLVAGSLSLPEAEGIARHLMGVKLHDQTFVMELMTFLRFYNPPIEDDSVFTYNVNDRTETVELRRNRWGRTLRFGKEQLENADFAVISGDVHVRAFYTGTLNEKLLQEEEPTVTVRKTYSVVEGGGFVPGALVRVTITVDKASIDTSSPRTHYGFSINDIIPSGARFAKNDSQSRWVNNSLQRIYTSVCICSRCTGRVSYLIRLVNSGEFITESAVARNSAGDWGKSERGVIVIA
jgi:hypothetical protein